MSESPGDQLVMSWLVRDAHGVPAPVPVPGPPPARARRPGRWRSWPLLLIAAPAAVSIWSGWVGLGGLCGFGYLHPLPGIMDSFRINTAITLPVGVEAYGAYALGAWLNPDTPVPARRFARWSAIGSLFLGALGQVAYHLLAAFGWHRAPVAVIVAVACIPVIALGFGAALMHLRHLPPGVAPVAAPAAGTAVPEPPAALNGHAAAAAELFAARLAAGQVPGIRAIRRGLKVGQPKAQQVREYLRDLASVPAGLNGDGPHE